MLASFKLSQSCFNQFPNFFFVFFAVRTIRDGRTRARPPADLATCAWSFLSLLLLSLPPSPPSSHRGVPSSQFKPIFRERYSICAFRSIFLSPVITSFCSLTAPTPLPCVRQRQVVLRYIFFKKRRRKNPPTTFFWRLWEGGGGEGKGRSAKAVTARSLCADSPLPSFQLFDR